MTVDDMGIQGDGVAELAGRRGMRLMLRFGSTVAGAHHPHSGRDRAIMFETGDGPLRVLSEISEDLREWFPGREINLAVVNRASPLF